MRYTFNTHATKERRLLYFSPSFRIGRGPQPSPDADKEGVKQTQKKGLLEGLDPAAVESSVANNTINKPVAAVRGRTVDAQDRATRSLRQTTLPSLQQHFEGLVQHKYKNVPNGEQKALDEINKLVQFDLDKDGKTLVLAGSKETDSEVNDISFEAIEAAIRSVGELLKKVIDAAREAWQHLDLNSLSGGQGIIPIGKDSSENVFSGTTERTKTSTNNAPENNVEKRGGTDVQMMRAKALDKELDDLETVEKSINDQIDAIAKKIAVPDENKNARAQNKEIADLLDKKDKIEPRRKEIAAEKLRRTNLIAKEWNEAVANSKVPKEKRLFKSVHSENDMLIFEFADGVTEEDMQNLRDTWNKVDADIKDNNTVSMDPTFFVEEGGRLSSQRRELLNAVAKLTKKPAGAGGGAFEKGDEEAPEANEKLKQLAEKLNTRQTELLENAGAFTETPLGKIFSSAKYHPAKYGENLELRIDGGHFDRMLAIAKKNGRNVDESHRDYVIISGGPGSQPWKLPKSGLIVMPCHKAWGGKEGDAESQVHSAEQGMKGWEHSMVTTVQETKIIQTSKTIDNLSRTASTTEAKSVKNALDDLRNGLSKGMKNMPVGKFVEGLSIRDGENGGVSVLCDNSPNSGGKDFAHFVNDLFPGGVIALDENTSNYVVQLSQDQVPALEKKLGRLKVFLCGPEESGDDVLAQDSEAKPESKQEDESPVVATRPGQKRNIRMATDAEQERAAPKEDPLLVNRYNNLNTLIEALGLSGEVVRGPAEDLTEDSITSHANSIVTALEREKDDTTASIYLDGGSLREKDWGYDHEIIDNFRETILKNPERALWQFSSINPDDWGNEKVKGRLAGANERYRSRMQEMAGGNSNVLPYLEEQISNEDSETQRKYSETLLTSGVDRWSTTPIHKNFQYKVLSSGGLEAFSSEVLKTNDKNYKAKIKETRKSGGDSKWVKIENGVENYVYTVRGDDLIAGRLFRHLPNQENWEVSSVDNLDALPPYER